MTLRTSVFFDLPMVTVVSIQLRETADTISCESSKKKKCKLLFFFQIMSSSKDHQHELKQQTKMNTVNILKAKKLIEEMNSNIIYICKI